MRRERVTEIRVDFDVCVGAGMCALTAPEVFDQDEKDGRVVVRTARPAPDDVPAVEEAVSLCPSGAITCVTLGVAPDTDPDADPDPDPDADPDPEPDAGQDAPGRNRSG